MSPLTLQYPVYTLDNKLLLPAGAVLTEETLDALIDTGKSESFKFQSLMQYNSVAEDIRRFITVPPFDVVFSNKDHLDEVLTLMESVQLALPMLKSLDYFKENDFPTYRHSLVVFALTILISKILMVDRQDVIAEITAGPTHDFGKISIPLDILHKRTPLTREEHDFLKHHTLAGYVLLSYYLHDSLDSSSAILARDHHERKNGSGYPGGILQDDIVVEIVAVCDIYDALVSPRPYRAISYDNRTALEEITAMAERGEIGWDVVSALISQNRQDKPHFREMTVSLEKRGVPPSGNVYGCVTGKDNSGKK